MPKRIAMLATLCVALISHAAADESGPKASLTAERHHTTNALDGSTTLADWYTVMRGGLEVERRFGSAVLVVKGDAEASRYDRHTIEDDVKGSLAAALTLRPAERLELRGTVSWHALSDGDDLEIEGFTIGTHTPTHRLGANVEAGLDIGEGRTLVLELANSYEHNRPTAFEDDVFDPVKLEPDKHRHRLTLAAAQRIGGWSLGLRGFGGVGLAEKLGDPPLSESFMEAGLRGEIAGTLPHEIALKASLGAELIAALSRKESHVVPVAAVELEIPLGKWAVLSPQFQSRIETGDTDDPLASWVRRAQVEITIPLAERVTLGAGAFVQSTDNLTLAYDERGMGLYGELAYVMPNRYRLVLRSEYEQEEYPALGEAKRTLDTFLGFRAEL